MRKLFLAHAKNTYATTNPHADTSKYETTKSRIAASELIKVPSHPVCTTATAHRLDKRLIFLIHTCNYSVQFKKNNSPKVFIILTPGY